MKCRTSVPPVVSRRLELPKSYFMLHMSMKYDFGVVTSVLQCVAVFCSCCICLWNMTSVWSHMCCSVLQCVVRVAYFYEMWLRCGHKCVAVCCSVLQCVAVCCSCCICLWSVTSVWSQVCCSVLQCVAVCCSVLQCVVRVAYVYEMSLRKPKPRTCGKNGRNRSSEL